MPSDRQRSHERHLAALDLVDAWIHDQDADLSNVADRLAREPKAACYALAQRPMRMPSLELLPSRHG